MHSVASVAPAGSSRRSETVYRAPSPVSSTTSVRSVKSTGNTQAPVNVSPSSSAQNAAASVGPNLPVGLLLSVSRPSSGNGPATTDYDTMQNDLRSGNVSAAQQAYLRLQTDLLMAQSPVSSGSTTPLNTTA